MNTRQYLDQRRLTRPVITDQRHHLTGVDLKIDIRQCRYGAKIFETLLNLRMGWPLPVIFFYH